MKYSEPLLAQTQTVFVFLGVGFLLGVWYLICCFIRRLSGDNRTIMFFVDLLFFIGAFTACFATFLSYTNGIWRLPDLFSAAGGFCLFWLSIGRALEKAVVRFADKIRFCVAAVFSPIRKRSESLHSFLHEICRKTALGSQRNKAGTGQKPMRRKHVKNYTEK